MTHASSAEVNRRAVVDYVSAVNVRWIGLQPVHVTKATSKFYSGAAFPGVLRRAAPFASSEFALNAGRRGVAR